MKNQEHVRELTDLFATIEQHNEPGTRGLSLSQVRLLLELFPVVGIDMDDLSDVYLEIVDTPSGRCEQADFLRIIDRLVQLHGAWSESASLDAVRDSFVYFMMCFWLAPFFLLRYSASIRVRYFVHGLLRLARFSLATRVWIEDTATGFAVFFAVLTIMWSSFVVVLAFIPLYFGFAILGSPGFISATETGVPVGQWLIGGILIAYYLSSRDPSRSDQRRECLREGPWKDMHIVAFIPSPSSDETLEPDAERAIPLVKSKLTQNAAVLLFALFNRNDVFATITPRDSRRNISIVSTLVSAGFVFLPYLVRIVNGWPFWGNCRAAELCSSLDQSNVVFAGIASAILTLIISSSYTGLVLDTNILFLDKERLLDGLLSVLKVCRASGAHFL